MEQRVKLVVIEALVVAAPFIWHTVKERHRRKKAGGAQYTRRASYMP
jgi:hypothetical protein